jgi:predicted nucleic acid-binding protein
VAEQGQAVINPSPLIFLSRSRYLSLLQAFAREKRVPDPVAGEIRHRGSQDITIQATEQTAWLISKPAPDIPAPIVEWQLGVGQSSTLALGPEHPDTEAIIDDRAGRRCAGSLGIPVRGTLGIVLVAKQGGVVREARPIIEDMMGPGLYLSREVVEAALRRVGE